MGSWIVSSHFFDWNHCLCGYPLFPCLENAESVFRWLELSPLYVTSDWPGSERTGTCILGLTSWLWIFVINFLWSILKVLLANLHSKLSSSCFLWLTQQNLGPETLPVHLFPQSFKTFFFSFFNQQVFFILLFQRPGPVPEFQVKNRHSAFAWHSSWHASALSMFFKRYFFPGLLIAPPL